jgi:hypothetical protein
MTIRSRSTRAFLLLLIFTSASFAAEKGGCIPGSYLMHEAGGAFSLWTFTKEGTIQMASSAQGPLNFSDGHGAWKQTGSRKAKTSFLDFNYGQAPPPDAVARVDAVLTFSKKCTTVQGDFELRFFDLASEDPLDLNSDTGDPIPVAFTGRRITTKK